MIGMHWKFSQIDPKDGGGEVDGFESTFRKSAVITFGKSLSLLSGISKWCASNIDKSRNEFKFKINNRDY